MFYILAVVASAVTFGVVAGLATATAAFLAYNFFFLPPAYTFSISDPRDFVALLVFFAVAIATGSLAGRLREVAEQARQRSNFLETLNSLALRLSAAASPDEIAEALVLEASKAAGEPAVLLRRNDRDLTVMSKHPGTEPLSTEDWQAAQRCASSGQTIYPVAAGWPGSRYEFRPLRVGSTLAGVFGLHQRAFDETRDATMDAMVYQTALAWERLSLQAEKSAAERQADAERLRSVLLSSVSHDIKTPLAAIQGAVTSLRELGPKLSDDSKTELLATIEEETVRLTRFVTNMLDMVRFQSGAPNIRTDWIDLVDTIGASVARARKTKPGARITFDAEASPAIVRGDETLLDHVFLNVIENAANASPEGGEIGVSLRSTDSGFCVDVVDQGPGIAPDVLPRIFDKFYRAPGTKTQGSGLGLTICKEVMTALDGRISVQSPATIKGGTRISLHFPEAENHTTTGGSE
jgi:two-component system sensor histidine kinase KdpD